jgi:hypothetical protein
MTALTQRDPVLGAMKLGPDETWVAQVDDVEFVIAGDRAGPFAAQREEAARVAPQLSAVVATLKGFLVRTTACDEAAWPRSLPLEFRKHVSVPGAERRWSLQWLEFQPGVSGAYRAFFVFDDEAQEMIYVLWIIDVQDDVPRAVSWKNW